MYNYAFCLEQGIEVEMDKKKAAKYYFNVILKGNSQSMLQLGRMLIIGDLGYIDEETCLHLIIKSADLGCKEAMNMYASLLKNGISCKQDLKKAVKRRENMHFYCIVY